MPNAMGQYLRRRARERGISLSAVARLAGKSRQTIQALSEGNSRLPELSTLIDIAVVLQVHPMRLLQLVFEDYRLPLKEERRTARRGDKSTFVADVTIPDGTLVAAGSRFTKTWQVQNVGTVPWEGRVLKCVDDELVVLSRRGETLLITEPLRPVVDAIPVPFTAPGDVVELSVDFIAPRVPCTCISYWKSFFASGGLCMPKSVGLSCKVRVLAISGTDDAGL